MGREKGEEKEKVGGELEPDLNPRFGA